MKPRLNYPRLELRRSQITTLYFFIDPNELMPHPQTMVKVPHEIFLFSKHFDQLIKQRVNINDIAALTLASPRTEIVLIPER